MEIYVDGKLISNFSEIRYIAVNCSINVWGTKMKFGIDVGNDYQFSSKITDANGHEVQFRSPIDVMNYVSRCGWNYLETQATTNSSGVVMRTIIFERP